MDRLFEKLYTQHPDNKQEKEESEKNFKEIINKFENEGYGLGEGKAAKITSVESFDEICLKSIHNKDISCNDVEKEMEFLDKLSTKGYPVPKPICNITIENHEYIFMETIKGISIANILDDTNGTLTKETLKDFDFKSFFIDLRSIIKKLHDEERTHHRDLHPGNVMINENNDPVIIDFGDAVKLNLSSDNPYNYTNMKGKQIINTPDIANINRTYAKLGKHLQKFGLI